MMEETDIKKERVILAGADVGEDEDFEYRQL